jgi:hypothetical protein
MEASGCFNPRGRGPGTYRRRKRLGWSQILSGHFGEEINFLPLPGFRLYMVHPEPRHCTDYTISDLPATVFGSLINITAIFILLTFCKIIKA